MKKLEIVTVDGPSGAGKSTSSKMLAQRLSFIYVDTGAMYRCAALKAMKLKINYDDRPSIEKMLEETKIEFMWSGKNFEILLDGENVTEVIRGKNMGMEASNISTKEYVRKWMRERQRKMGERGGAVFDGRDMGTVVFPDARYKFFLTASEEVRARRIYESLRARGEICHFQEILEEIRRRDEQDSSRAVAPLRKAEDAVLIDTTALSPEEVVEKMLKCIEEMRKMEL